MMVEARADEHEEPCGCGMWVCRQCRPENFDPAHPLNKNRRTAAEEAIRQAKRFPHRRSGESS